jgi:hypothetical protein
VFASIVAACIAPAASHATVTHSSATAGAPFVFVDYSLETPKLHVTATTDGIPPDKVDIRCEGAGTSFLVTSGVSVGPDGSVAADVDEDKFDSRYCRLAVVPAGTIPANLAPFAGPFVGGGGTILYNVLSGPNAGVPYDFGVAMAQSKGYADYLSVGSCGLCDMRLLNPDTGAASPKIFFGAAMLWIAHDDGSGGVRESTIIDGKPAYPAWNADGRGETLAGLPPVTLSHTFDPATGDVTFQEAEDFVACSPSESTCTSFVPTGLRFERQVRQDHAARSVRVTDVLRNLSASDAHTYDLDYNEYAQASTNHLGFRLPGEPGYTERHVGAGTTSAGFGPITTIGLITDATVPIGFDNPVGTLTASPQPNRLLYADEGFFLNYTGTVQPGGTQTIRQFFAMGASQAEVDGLAAAHQDELGAPAVAFTAPADGTAVTSTPTTVTGTATDNGGAPSLKVNGADVAVAPDGTWTTQVALSLGANTVTATAKDAFGNEAIATRSITLKPAPVATITRSAKPKLKRKGKKLVLDTGLIVHCPPGLDACTTVGSAKTAKAVASKVRKRKVTLATKRLTTPAGKSQRVVMTLSAKGVKAFKRNKKLLTKITVAARVGTGTPTRKTLTATLKRPKKKR